MRWSAAATASVRTAGRIVRCTSLSRLITARLSLPERRGIVIPWSAHLSPRGCVKLALGARRRYSHNLLDMNLHCLVDSRSIWVFISSSMVCPLYWARSPVGRFPNKPSQVIGACIFNDDSACCVQGGPTEIYYGNWSILYVWERFFNFSYISQTAYTELD